MWWIELYSWLLTTKSTTKVLYYTQWLLSSWYLVFVYMLDHSASGRNLVAMVEQLASNHDNTSLMAQIVEQVGLTTPTELVINVV